ncbi:MAG: low molecular weight phosphotyrosine protein phosphatase [Rhodocyclaceae bacterium]|nr:low molecular weight phosphotyrosine protein phosphatase [Rhodocyclaceae bacterium]
MTERILFVCMGNICRSPTAEGVARAMAQKWGLDQCYEFDSAGTHGYHVGSPPDRRAQWAAAKRGYDLSGLRARQVEIADFHRFDRILAMDYENLSQLTHLCPPQERGKLGLLLHYAKTGLEEVPDPYYGGPEGFEYVLDLIEQAIAGLLGRPVRSAYAPGSR